jgi:hypothetical protein
VFDHSGSTEAIAYPFIYFAARLTEYSPLSGALIGSRFSHDEKIWTDRNLTSRRIVNRNISRAPLTFRAFGV